MAGITDPVFDHVATDAGGTNLVVLGMDIGFHGGNILHWNLD
ncbi:MAG: hypothetical protein R2857_04355 [Vampirovibrionales bacterium]